MYQKINAFKLEIFVPETHLSILQKALKDVDAGHIGKYDCCMSYSKVTSVWRPLEGSHPYIGNKNKLSKETELKIEVCCEVKNIEKTIKAIKSIHPYEEPVINVIPMIIYK